MSGDLNSCFKLGHYELDLYRSSFPNERAQTGFLKKCLIAVRYCPEYREWVSYVKEILGYKVCVFTHEVADELTIEIHHHPFTLYDIIELELNRHLVSGEVFCSMDLVKKV